MKTIHHLCQGGSAAAMLRAALTEPVIEIHDDAAIGPLADVDTDSPDARVRFMKALLEAGGFDIQDNDSMDWYGELRDMNRRLATLADTASEVVIWAEPSDTEQALRRRAHWWLRNAAVPVSEIACATPDVAHVKALIEKRAAVDAQTRARLAQEWEALRKDGDALRVWENDALRSYPIDHYDASFAELMSAQASKLPGTDVLDAAMRASGRSELFCKWRFQVLAAQGKGWNT